MKIKISDERTIGELKKEFNSKFPFLQLEFFSGSSEKGFPNPLQRIVDERKTLKNFRGIHNEGELVVTGFDQVGALEKSFMEKFGLTVQVFRQSGDQWLLTTSTDGFSLNHQNAMGREMSLSIADDEPMDIHEQE